jgi:thiamine-phosphate pyrophosphorylase
MRGRFDDTTASVGYTDPQMLVVGFYAVLDREDEALARTLVGPGGAKILQVRIKPAETRDIVRVAKMARRICDEAGALLVINDRVDIALAVRADAVHLGQTDLSLPDARAIAGDRLAIGISTHNLHQVEAAVAQRPDYIAYGPIFATTTKQNPDPVQGLDALRVAVEAAGTIPVVAIGGVSPAHASEVYASGASAICAISAVNNAGDVTAAARSFARV